MVLHAARIQVRDYMNVSQVSETLALALASEVSSDFFRAEATGRLILPYYWARYVHDGRGPVGTERLMRFFPDKRDDPRTAKGIAYPGQRGARRSLTKQEISFFNKENWRRHKVGEPPIMVVCKFVQSGKQSKPGTQFYVNALRFFRPPRSVEDRLNEVVKRLAPSGSRSLVLRLGR